MAEFDMEEMQRMQVCLQEKYLDKWGGLSPEKGRQTLLWMIGEAGEVADVIKKNGDRKIMEDEAIRAHFVEEMCDVLMYFNDLMLCYSVSAQELEKVYLDKFRKNMQRW